MSKAVSCENDPRIQVKRRPCMEKQNILIPIS